MNTSRINRLSWLCLLYPAYAVGCSTNIPEPGPAGQGSAGFAVAPEGGTGDASAADAGASLVAVDGGHVCFPDHKYDGSCDPKGPNPHYWQCPGVYGTFDMSAITNPALCVTFTTTTYGNPNPGAGFCCP